MYEGGLKQFCPYNAPLLSLEDTYGTLVCRHIFVVTLSFVEV